MKKLAILILYCMPIFGMQEALKDAIQNDAVEEVEQILQQLAHRDSQQMEPSAESSLLPRVNLDEIQHFSAQLLEQKKTNAATLNNSDFYKRITASLATLGASWAPVSFCLYQGYAVGQWPSKDLFLASVGSAAIGSLVSVNQLRLACTNADAKNKRAQQFVIAHLIAQAKAESQSQESV